MQLFSDAIAHSKMERLDFGFNSYLPECNTTALNILFSGIARVPSLKHIGVSNCSLMQRLSDESYSIFINTINRSDTLTSIDITYDEPYEYTKYEGRLKLLAQAIRNTKITSVEATYPLEVSEEERQYLKAILGSVLINNQTILKRTDFLTQWEKTNKSLVRLNAQDVEKSRVAKMVSAL